ncbi:MAG TPA: TetR/AcrR family transcriptional regulator [Acidimicrobiales bacterium]|nr:TetR/AcrR family transcriptional regulator [Acidimicrobiales bacterium]
MAPGRTRETTGQRRRDILEAALDTFIQVGESGTFIQEVCSRADVSVGTLYHHFGSKDQLIATLHYALLDDYQSGAGPILTADPPAEPGVRETVAYHVNWLVGHPRQATFLLQQPFAGYRSDQVPADLLQDNAAFLEVVHGWLDRRMEDGQLKKLPFDVVVALLIGPVHHWVRGELYLDPVRAAAKAPEAVTALADGAWQALRP